MRHQVIGDETLESVISKKGIWVLVAFMYYGSVPCRIFRREFARVGAYFGSKIYSAEINAQENPSIAFRLSVTAVPTTLLLYNGLEKGRFEGPYSHEALIERIGKLLDKSKA